MNFTENEYERFWSKVDVRSDYDCWEWTAAHTNEGYGRFKLRGKSQSPHRISFALFNGIDLSDIDDCCHRCDNPKCVNPSHLFNGSRSDNMVDCWEKGRNSFQIYGRVIKRRENHLTHCSKGHEYSIVGIHADGKCAECSRQKIRKYREAKKKQAQEA